MGDGSETDDRRVADSLVAEGSSLGAALREATRVHETWATRVEQHFETMLRSLDAVSIERDELTVRLEDANAELQVMREEQESLWDQLRAVQQQAADVVAERDRLAQGNADLSESLDAAQRLAASNDLKAYKAEERCRQAQSALEEAGESHQAALMREVALTDAVAALEKELDALADEREEMQLVRDGLEAQVREAAGVERDLQEQLVARDATMVAMQAELDASEESRVELAKRVDAMEAEVERARQGAPADRPGPRPASGDDDESKRRPARGDGGVVEVVRHRSDVGNRL